MLARASNIDVVLEVVAGGGVGTDPFCCNNPSDLRRSAGGLPGGVVDSSVERG